MQITDLSKAAEKSLSEPGLELQNSWFPVSVLRLYPAHSLTGLDSEKELGA